MTDGPLYLDTLRLPGDALDELLGAALTRDESDRADQSRRAGSNAAPAPRHAFRTVRRWPAELGDGAGATRCQVIPVSLSCESLLCLYGAYVYADTPCLVLLPAADGKLVRTRARIGQCRNLRGRAHTVEILFETRIDVGEFVSTVAGERAAAYDRELIRSLAEKLLVLTDNRAELPALRTAADAISSALRAGT